MSNEPKSKNGEWSMPEPVFRTSPGHTPRSALHDEADDIDTASPDFTEADTDEFDTEPVSQDEIDTETPESAKDEDSSAETPASPQNSVRPAAAKKQAGGCLKTFGLVAGMIAFSVIALIAVIVYFLVFYRPADTAF